ncbi:thioredoxin [Paenibacillus pini JCM 16418]|uniref:Thioredoxin n=1 Tax=Paenibacillus pini JCM 16418 TaxID=1236976 RepID=W7YIN4_9BACL|nr:thioredoxin [Paenibacillus pini JCM 16418]
MSKNLANKLDTGISPSQFMEGMQKNQEAFISGYEQFSWTNESDREFFESLKFRDDLRVMILAADWCGDVVRNVPVVFRALETADIPTEVLILEENFDVMDQFLTMGGRGVPIVIFLDTGGYVLGHWGPRPKHVQEVMVNFKKENPDREAPDYQDKMTEVRKD